MSERFGEEQVRYIGVLQPSISTCEIVTEPLACGIGRGHLKAIKTFGDRTIIKFESIPRHSSLAATARHFSR
eukprot:313253-Amorphochlora_amoeboformis.AAC.3